MLNPSLIRRIRQVARAVSVASALSAIAIAMYGDWPDALLVGLAGVFLLSVARSSTWTLRHHDPRSR